MLIACPKESITDEKKVALTPESAFKFKSLDIPVVGRELV